MSRAARSSQDWGHEVECICGFLSVTFYFSVKLLSRVPISKTWIVFWPCDDCYSPSYSYYGPMMTVIPLVTVVMYLVSGFLLNFIFCLKLPCITIYKHMLPWIKHPFSLESWVPCILLFVTFSSSTPVPRSRSVKTISLSENQKPQTKTLLDGFLSGLWLGQNSKAVGNSKHEDLQVVSPFMLKVNLLLHWGRKCKQKMSGLGRS